MSHLILVRHGESRWNIANKFTGWVDVPLSEVGILEALVTAKNLEGLDFDVAFTSQLERAQETLLIICSEQRKTAIFQHKDPKFKKWSAHHGKSLKEEIPVHFDDALNERMYGDLQGIDKDFARRKWGKEQVHVWRRSYKVKPPKGESLFDVYKRAVPYFQKHILPLVKAKKNVIVAAHGNSLRAIIKFLDDISDEQIPHLELRTGKPIIYKYSRGKLTHDDDHKFNRPIDWEHTPSLRKKSSRPKAAKSATTKKTTVKKTSTKRKK